MPYPWENRERMADVRSQGLWGHVCWFLGIIFAILGIIAGAMNAAIGLDSVEWFLLGILTLVAGMAFFIGMAAAWYLKTTK